MLPPLEMASAWTQLWKTGQFESLPGDRAAGALHSLDAAWGNFFSALAPGARLLDLATGGGDVIRRAIAMGRKFNLVGVDLAELSAVAQTFEGAEVDLLGNTELSHLPFKNSSFDGVVSQFGVEYGDIPRATHEAARVLKDGGMGHFVLHHAHSGITRGVVENLQADESVFADVDVFQQGRTVFELYRCSPPPQDPAEAESRFGMAVSLLQSRLRHGRAYAPGGKILAQLARLAVSPHRYVPEHALRQIDEIEADFRMRKLRKLAQLDAALDESGIEKVSRGLAAGGATVSAVDVLRYPGGNILGWTLRFHKRSIG